MYSCTQHIHVHVVCHCVIALADLSKQWNYYEVLTSNGCSEKCATEKHCLTSADIIAYHDHFAAMERPNRKQWLLTYFCMNSSTDCPENTTYFIGGKPVCMQLWASVLGVSISYVYKVRALYLDGHKRLVSHNDRSRSTKTMEAVAWMENFFNLNGDRMPDRAVVHLPSSMSKLDVYHCFRSEQKEKRAKKDVASRTTFLNTWKSDFSHVTIPKV